MNNNAIKKDKPLILVVDDELVGRIYIEKALQDEGYDVVTAENGQQAIELVASQTPDMVVMDVMMPIMDGYAASRAIRKNENENENAINVPILMLTGLDDIESVEKSFAAGATDFVVKPVNLPIFKQRVRYGIATHEAALVLNKQQQRLQQAQAVAQMGYWDWDVENNFVYWSGEACKILSLSTGELQNSYEALMAIVHPDDRKKVQFAISQSIEKNTVYSVEHKVLRDDQQLQVLYQNAELIKDDAGKVIRMLGIIQDVTEKHLSQKKIQYLAYYDSLTDLPNRILFCDQLDQAIKLANQRKKSVAILMIDIDRFSNINASLGHDIGDEFIAAISKSLKEALGTNGQLGKISDVKFGLFIENDTSIEALTNLADKLLNTLSKTYEVKGNKLVCTGSIGIISSSLENKEVELLIRQADRAMSEAKKSGGNRFHFYNKTMKFHTLHMLTVERELRKAMQTNELVVYYQPKCSVETGRIKGMEALIRWNHPEKGLVPPNDFISIAEETGQIVPIGKWVLEEACKQTVKWHQQGFKDLVISVNVSVKQFHHKGFTDDVFTALNNSGIDYHCVDLEITESCSINGFEKAINLLNSFREKGINISMDDFGTGFSSLSFLQKLPLDTLKVDRAFIKDITANGENGELAKLIIAVAKELKLSVVAEGVETEEHLHFLKEARCDEFQGYLTSPALPASQFKELLVSNAKETQDFR
ncbi:MAG: EAL domain-containing protein [Colwellia sp.]|nr:EAL domain-containing protein [Colwellia sp.]